MKFVEQVQSYKLTDFRTIETAHCHVEEFIVCVLFNPLCAVVEKERYLGMFDCSDFVICHVGMLFGK